MEPNDAGDPSQLAATEVLRELMNAIRQRIENDSKRLSRLDKAVNAPIDSSLHLRLSSAVLKPPVL